MFFIVCFLFKLKLKLIRDCGFHKFSGYIQNTFIDTEKTPSTHDASN